MVIRFGSSSSINGSDETLRCESLSLSRVRSIEDGVLRFCHVAREEEGSRDLVLPIVNRRTRFSYDTSNSNCYNSSDE